MRTTYLLIFFSLSILFISSCKTLTSNRMFSVPENYEYTSFKKSNKEYVINPYDRIVLKVYTNKASELVSSKIQMNQNNALNYVVEYDGQVKLPTLGRVKLAGLTIRKAEKKLEEMYKKTENKPFVFMEVINKRVIVFSNGATQGSVITFKDENFNLIEALAQVGGVSDFAKSYKIKLLRGDLNNPEVYKFNIRNLKDIKETNFRLQSNDIIYVEARPRFASKTLSEITPYLSLITSFFTIYLLLKQQTK